MLEHAVHLGSAKYPDERDYKAYLAQHGGASNASTSMTHTQYHLTVRASALRGALDRLAQFFAAPLLRPEDVLREVENVHSEYSRNCNSGERVLERAGGGDATRLHGCSCFAVYAALGS